MIAWIRCLDVLGGMSRQDDRLKKGTVLSIVVFLVGGWRVQNLFLTLDSDPPILLVVTNCWWVNVYNWIKPIYDLFRRNKNSKLIYPSFRYEHPSLICEINISILLHWKYHWENVHFRAELSGTKVSETTRARAGSRCVCQMSPHKRWRCKFTWIISCHWW